MNLNCLSTFIRFKFKLLKNFIINIQMKLLSQLDIYRQEPKIKIKGEESIGSTVGGLFTLFYMTIVIAFAIYTLIPIANR